MNIQSDHRAPVVCMDSCVDKDGGALLCTGSSDASARVCAIYPSTLLKCFWQFVFI